VILLDGLFKVENLDIKFNELKTLRNKNWEDDTIVPLKLQKKKVIVTTNNKAVKSSSGLRAMILGIRGEEFLTEIFILNA
jgi:hypothetical protein